MRIFLITVIFLFTFLLGHIVLAQENSGTLETSSTSSAAVNSYELFWPLSAGKIEGDSLYSLKILKEQIGGWFVFGDTKKADYVVLLGTKRVLEAEKLLKNGKIDLALRALEKADAQYSSAYSQIKAAAPKGKFSAGEIRRDRLIYVKRLIDYLKTTSPEKTYAGLDTVKERADAILRDYLP